MAEHRREMIERHKKVVELQAQMKRCLDSGNSSDVCQNEMKKNCESMLGSECPPCISRNTHEVRLGRCWK